MARRRRPGSLTSVVDGRAELVIPIESITDADAEPMRFDSVAKWWRRVGRYPDELDVGDPGLSLVLDGFAWDLHLGDVGHATDTHDGPTFLNAATADGTVAIYVVDGTDPRRCSVEDLDAAARNGHVIGARVAAFPVDVLQS